MPFPVNNPICFAHPGAAVDIARINCSFACAAPKKLATLVAIKGITGAFFPLILIPGSPPSNVTGVICRLTIFLASASDKFSFPGCDLIAAIASCSLNSLVDFDIGIVASMSARPALYRFRCSIFLALPSGVETSGP